MICLAECYSDGTGCEKDLNKALYYYKSAQQNGNNDDIVKRRIKAVESELVSLRKNEKKGFFGLFKRK